MSIYVSHNKKNVSRSCVKHAVCVLIVPLELLVGVEFHENALPFMARKNTRKPSKRAL